MAKLLVSIAMLIVAIAYALYWRAMGGNVFLGL
jgi:hypothetical protein